MNNPSLPTPEKLDTVLSFLENLQKSCEGETAIFYRESGAWERKDRKLPYKHIVVNRLTSGITVVILNGVS